MTSLFQKKPETLLKGRPSKRRRLFRKMIAALILPCFLGISGCASAAGAALPLAFADSASVGLQVNVIDVGQGLSVLVESDGHRLLYDGGPQKSSSKLVSWLKKNLPSDDQTIDVMVSSHYDSDHVSGLNGVLNVFDVGSIYSSDGPCDNRSCTSFISRSEDHNPPLQHPSDGDKLKLGKAEIEFFNGKNEDTSDSSANDYSLVVKVSSKDGSVLMSGDLESDREGVIADKYGKDLKSMVYVAGHHGSSTSSSEAFLDAVDPSITVISCGKDNSYGHPHKETLERLEEHHEQILRTDLEGTIEIDLVKDKASVKTEKKATEKEIETPGSGSAEKKETKSAPKSEKMVAPAPSGDSEAQDYILNTRSHIIHLPDCKSVKKMSDRNKQEVHESIASLESQGYRPCKICLAGQG